jgi:hypothetical protein
MRTISKECFEKELAEHLASLSKYYDRHSIRFNESKGEFLSQNEEHFRVLYSKILSCINLEKEEIKKVLRISSKCFDFSDHYRPIVGSYGVRVYFGHSGSDECYEYITYANLKQE